MVIYIISGSNFLFSAVSCIADDAQVKCVHMNAGTLAFLCSLTEETISTLSAAIELIELPHHCNDEVKLQRVSVHRKHTGKCTLMEVLIHDIVPEIAVLRSFLKSQQLNVETYQLSLHLLVEQKSFDFI